MLLYQFSGFYSVFNTFGLIDCVFFVERGKLVTQRKKAGLAIKREPGFESLLCYRFKVWAFSFSTRHPSCMNEYLATDHGGNMND